MGRIMRAKSFMLRRDWLSSNYALSPFLARWGVTLFPRYFLARAAANSRDNPLPAVDSYRNTPGAIQNTRRLLPELKSLMGQILASVAFIRPRLPKLVVRFSALAQSRLGRFAAKVACS